MAKCNLAEKAIKAEYQGQVDEVFTELNKAFKDVDIGLDKSIPFSDFVNLTVPHKYFKGRIGKNFGEETDTVTYEEAVSRINKVAEESLAFTTTEDESQYQEEGTDTRFNRVSNVISTDKEYESYHVAKFGKRFPDSESMWLEIATDFESDNVKLFKTYSDKHNNPVIKPVFDEFIQALEDAKSVFANSSLIGNLIDHVVRDVVEGVVNEEGYTYYEGINKAEFGNKAEFDNLVASIQEVKSLIEADGSKLIGKELRLLDREKSILGTNDLLFIRRDGTVGIVDIKTRKTDVNGNSQLSIEKLSRGYRENDSTLQKWTKQQSAYKELLEQMTGLKVTTLEILPLDVTYSAGKPKVSKIGVNKRMTLNYKPILGLSNSVTTIGNDAQIPLSDFLDAYADKFREKGQGFSAPEFYKPQLNGQIKFQFDVDKMTEVLVEKVKGKVEIKEELTKDLSVGFKESEAEMRRTLFVGIQNLEVLINDNSNKGILSNSRLGVSNVQYLSSIYKELTEEGTVHTLESSIEGVAEYLIEAAKMIDLVGNQVLALPISPDSYDLSSSLTGLISVHSKMLQELSTDKDGKPLPNTNALSKFIKDAKFTLDSAVSHSAQIAATFSVDKQVETLLTPEVQEKIKGLQKRVKNLQDGLEGSKGAERVDRERRIEKYQKEIKDLYPSDKTIKAKLLGKLGDINKLGASIRSLFDVDDFSIQTFMYLMRKVQNTVAKNLKIFEQERATALDEYQKESGDFIGQRTNLEEFFGNVLTEQILSYQFNQEQYKLDVLNPEIEIDKRGIVEAYGFQMINEYDPAIYSELDRLKAVQARQWYLFHNGEDTSQAAIDEANRAVRDYKFNNFKSAYTPKGYAALEILETAVQDINEKGEALYLDEKGSVTTKDTQVAKYVTLKSVRRRTNKAQSAMRAGFSRNLAPSDVQLEAYKDAIRKSRDLKNTVNKEKGSAAYEIAKLLQQYDEETKGQNKYEVTNIARTQFDELYAEVKKTYENDPDSLARWEQVHTQRTFTDDYYKKTGDLYQEQSEIIDYININNPDIAESHNELRLEKQNIISKYKNNQGIVEGNLLTLAEQTRVSEISEKMKKLENDMKVVGLNNSSPAGIAALKRLEDGVEDLKTIWKNQFILDNGNKYKIEDSSRVNRETIIRYNGIVRRKTKLDKIYIDYSTPVNGVVYANAQAVTAAIKNLEEKILRLYDENHLKKKEELQEIKNKLNELRKTETTTFYQQEYEDRFQEFRTKSIDRSDYTKASYFQVDGTDFTKVNDIWQSNGKNINEDLFSIWKLSEEFLVKFRQSDWYKLNHTNDRKNSQWNYTSPKKESDIRSLQPAFHWSNRVEGEVVETDTQGRPVPKDELKGLSPRYVDFTPAQKKYSEFWIAKYLEKQEVYPSKKRMGYAIPAKRRELSIFDRAEGDFNGNALVSYISEKTTFTDDEGVDEVQGTAEGREAQYLPVYYSGNVDPTLISKNVYSTISDYISKAEQYEVMDTEVKPFVKATRKTLLDNPPLEKTKKLRNKIRSIAEEYGAVEKLANKEGQNNRLAIFTEMTDMFMYGEYSIRQSEQNPLMKYNKLMGNLQYAASAVMLAGNVSGQPGNYIGGKLNQIVQTAVNSGKTTFGMKDYLKADKDWATKYSWDFISDIGNIGKKSFFTNMADRHNMKDGWYANNMGATIKKHGIIKNVATTDVLFSAMNAVEDSIAATTFLAFARNYQVTVGGQTMSMWQAYEEHNQGKDIFEDPEGVDQSVILDFQMRLGKLNRHIQGSYGLLDKTIMSRRWYGAAAELMRKWLVSTYDRRYGSKKYSVEDGAIFEGYWNTSSKIFINAMKDLVKYRQTHAHKDLSPEEKDALRFATYEIMLLSLLTSILFIWRGGDDDDIEDLPAYQQYMAYGLYKGLREYRSLAPIFGVSELKTIIEDPVPQILPFYGEIVDIFTKTWDVSLQDGFSMTRYKSDTQNNVGQFEEGDLKLNYQLLKLIGIKQSKLDAGLGYSSLEALNRR